MIQVGLIVLLSVLVAAGWAYWLFAWASARALLLRKGPRARETTGFTPRVSILKPVKGADSEAFQNFSSFCEQYYAGTYEICFAVAEANDPVTAVIAKLRDVFPARTIRLIVAPPLGANPKSASLHALANQAAGDVLVLSDGDIRVGPDYLARVVAPLADPSIGVVTCPYRGILPGSFWARLEALHMNCVFLPAAALAHRLGQRVGMGATLALRREDLQRAGGFAHIADHLMDDYQLVAIIEELGLRTVLANYVVASVLGRVRFAEQWARETRWARGIRVTRPGAYFGLLLTFPTPWAIALLAVSGSWWAAAALGLTLLLRWAVAIDIERSLNNAQPTETRMTPHSPPPVHRGREGWGPMAQIAPGLPPPQPSPGLRGEGERPGASTPLASAFSRDVSSPPTRRGEGTATWTILLLLPLRDVMSLAVWIAGAAGRAITWRGQRFVLHRDGRLSPAAPVGRAPLKNGGLFAGAVRRLDAFLRRREGIFEYSSDPACALRVSIGTCRDAIELSDGTRLSPGDRICEIHLFNEHMPPIPREGPGMGWAAQLQEAFRLSLRMLAAEFERDPRFDGCVALYGNSNFVTRHGIRQLARMASRLHFELHDPPTGPGMLARLHDLGENMLIWALVRVHNPLAASGAAFRRERHRFFMSRKTLLERFGAENRVVDESGMGPLHNVSRASRPC